MLFGRAAENLKLLDGAAKAWADEGGRHLAGRQVDLDALLKGKPIDRSLDPRSVGVEVVFEPLWSIDGDWALVFTEAIRCFRCSLDHLAYTLASAFTKPLPEDVAERSEFPLYAEALSDSNANRKIGATDPAARAIIEGLQPSNASDPERAPLWVLHELDRRAKHRVLPVIGQSSRGVQAGSPVQWAEFRAGPLEDGAVVAAFAVVPDPDNTLNLDLSFYPEVALGGGLPYLGNMIETLTAIHDEIEQKVFSSLENFLV